MINSVDVVVGFVIGAREEADGAFNQVKLIAVGVHFGRIQNGMSEIVNESVVGIVSLGTVDDDGLQVFVPALRFTEKFAQGTFAPDRIRNETIYEFFGDIFVNVVGIGIKY